MSMCYRIVIGFGETTWALTVSILAGVLLLP
jgi:hypothetical protein